MLFSSAVTPLTLKRKSNRAIVAQGDLHIRRKDPALGVLVNVFSARGKVIVEGFGILWSGGRGEAGAQAFFCVCGQCELGYD